MSGPTLELADIFRQHGPAYRQTHSLPLHQHRLMQAIETCRTPALGGVVEWCDHGQYTHTRYRSCLMEGNFLWGFGAAESAQSGLFGQNWGAETHHNLRGLLLR